jgi:tyrosyl-DNA phosphodiesterase-1
MGQMIIATFKVPTSLGKGQQPEDSETEDDSDDDIQIIQPAIGWAYIGSHNFTPSAWGTLSGSGFNPILNVSVLLSLQRLFTGNSDIQLRARSDVPAQR